MGKAGVHLKPAIDLAYFQGGREHHGDEIGIVRKPGVKIGAFGKHLAGNHLEAELVAPDGAQAGDIPVLPAIVDEMEMIDVIVHCESHRIAFTHLQGSDIKIPEHAVQQRKVEGACIQRYFRIEVTFAGSVLGGLDVRLRAVP